MTVIHSKDGEKFEIETIPSIFTGEYPCNRNEWGIHFWANQTGRLTIIKEFKNAAVVKESGHHWRSGLGNFPYEYPKYYIGIFGMGKGRIGRVVDCFVVIYSIQYSKKTMKMAKELAFELMDSLRE